MSTNLRLSFALVLLCSVGISSRQAQAQDPLNCIEKRDKPLVCEHLIIKIADPRVVRRSHIKGSPICICLSDFPSVYAENQSISTFQVSAAEKIILDQWQLSFTQLQQLLRF